MGRSGRFNLRAGWVNLTQGTRRKCRSQKILPRRFVLNEWADSINERSIGGKGRTMPTLPSSRAGSPGRRQIIVNCTTMEMRRQGKKSDAHTSALICVRNRPYALGRRGTEAPRLALCSSALWGGVVAGRLRGAPPSETGPTGLGCRAIFLRTTRDSRLPACLAGMEEVTSGVIAFCSESTFAMSVEICAEIFFTS